MINECINSVFKDSKLTPIEIKETLRILGYESEHEFIKELLHNKPSDIDLPTYLKFFNTLLLNALVA